MERNEQLDELLDQSSPVEIAGITFDHSRILFELDPIAYATLVSDMGFDEDEDEDEDDE